MYVVAGQIGCDGERLTSSSRIEGEQALTRASLSTRSSVFL